MALGLRKTGCSVGAALAFWLGNPILNPATIIFMGFVLGWHWVGLRIVVGVTLVFVVAYLVQWLVRDDDTFRAPLPAISGGSDVPLEHDPAHESMWKRFLRALWGLSVSVLPEYLVLVLLLGAARAWLFPAGLAVAGTLFVIPTAGEIPIVQTLMSYGLSAGPAAALMTTLPPGPLSSTLGPEPTSIVGARRE